MEKKQDDNQTKVNALKNKIIEIQLKYRPQIKTLREELKQTQSDYEQTQSDYETRRDMVLKEIELNEQTCQLEVGLANKDIVELTTLVQVLILSDTQWLSTAKIGVGYIKQITHKLFPHPSHKFEYMTNKIMGLRFNVVCVPNVNDTWIQKYKQLTEEGKQHGIDKKINKIVEYITDLSNDLLPGGYLMLSKVLDFKNDAVKVIEQLKQTDMFAWIDNSAPLYLLIQKKYNEDEE